MSDLELIVDPANPIDPLARQSDVPSEGGLLRGAFLLPFHSQNPRSHAMDLVSRQKAVHLARAQLGLVQGAMGFSEAPFQALKAGFQHVVVHTHDRQVGNKP